MINKNKICFVVSSPGSAISFLKDQMIALNKDYSLYLVANFNDMSMVNMLTANEFHSIGICRPISVINDIKALWKLYHYFRKEHFNAVHSVTPKAGLLTALAAFLAHVPIRIHIFTGQVWATKHGFSRTLLKYMDKLIVLLDNHILVDGESQRQFLIQNHVISAKKSEVLGKGSICGVNTNLFKPIPEIRISERKKMAISDDIVVYVFMGRLNHDKGIEELILAFNRLSEEYSNIKLLLLGNEENNYISKLKAKGVNTDNRDIIYYGHTSIPAQTTQAGDIFCLPTYREGFGSSVIEASCLGLPVICSNAYGVMDAMVDGETGLRCKVGDVESLYQCMKKLYEDKPLRILLGEHGHERVIKHFSSEVITQHWIDYYHSLL